MKKDNKAIIFSAVVLVLASVSLNFIDKANEGYPDVKLEKNTSEFLAVTSTEYIDESEVTQVKIRTNAPDGTILFVSSQHPYSMMEMSDYAIVKNGKAQAEIEMSASLAPVRIPIEVTLKMEENQLSPNAVAIYGKNGENIIGENVFDNGNGFINSTVGSEEFIFPNEERYKKESFNSFIYYTFIQNYGDIFASIQPSADGSWEEVNIYLTETGSSDESWSTMTDETLQNFYGFFTKLVKDAEIVDKNADIKITFYDSDKNVLATNY